MANSILLLLLILLLVIAGCSQSVSPSEISTLTTQSSVELTPGPPNPGPPLPPSIPLTPGPPNPGPPLPPSPPSLPQPNLEPSSCSSLEIEYNFDPPSSLIDKKVDVFGVVVFATGGFSEAKTKHVANVLAKYLDNDENGIPDNPLVVQTMIEERAGMILFVDEDEEEVLFDRWDHDYYDPDKLQTQWADETNPSREFDATIEEVLHVITDVGYDNAYPDVFGEVSGSTLANLMDNARGGHFEETSIYNENRPWIGKSAVPSSYPPGAWYTYYDKTCTYDCMITEYIYWGLTSILGAQETRSHEIGHEWELHTKQLVKESDPGLYNLLTDPQWGLPTELPDGSYCK